MDTIQKMWNEVEIHSKGDSLKALFREFKFNDFKQALDFVNKVGRLAEDNSHHPDISLSWGLVKVWLTTHSENGITSKDHELAKLISQIQE